MMLQDKIQDSIRNRIHNKKAFLFDLDGTLVDSMWIWESIDVEYLDRFGLELPEDLHSCIEGMSFSETAQYFKERFSIPDTLEKMKSDWNRMAWEKYTQEVPLKSGIREFLRYHRARGVKMAVATSNSRELAEAVIAVHGLTDTFDVIVTGCDVAHGNLFRMSIWRRLSDWGWTPRSVWCLRMSLQVSRRAEAQEWRWPPWRMPTPCIRNVRRKNWRICILPIIRNCYRRKAVGNSRADPD